MKRDLVEIIDRLLPLLEANGVETDGLRAVRSSACFTAPEVMGLRWQEAQEWLQRKNPKEPAAWCAEAMKIWAGIA